MNVSARADIEIRRAADDVFDLAASCEGFPRFIHRLGPIPGVTHAELVDAAVPKSGVRRRISTTDGNVIEEELLAFERPSRHRYRWRNRPPLPFRLLVSGAEGDWSFAPIAGGTRIVWDYRFELTSPFVYPLAAVGMALFRRWMQRALARLSSLLTEAA